MQKYANLINLDMNRKILVLFLALTMQLLVFGQSRGLIEVEIDGEETQLYTESYALVIGVSDYTNGWDDLPGVKTDVEQVKTALEQNGFKVTTVMNPTSDKLFSAFDDFIKNYGSKEHP